MKRFYLYIAIVFATISCSKDFSGADQRLENARKYLANQEFDKAKQEIDSLRNIYPKAFEQRKMAMTLLDSIHKAENNFTITEMDKRLAEEIPIAEAMKKDFVFQKNEKYQDKGIYNPKYFYDQGIYYQTTLQAYVEEEGQICLQSIYLGSQKHNQLRVIVGGMFAETLVTEGDGAVHRFMDLGKTYESIRFMGQNENKVAQFIAQHTNANIKVELKGQHTTSYTLHKNVKEAIKKASELSVQMLLIEELKKKKEEAEFKNFYLDNDKQLTVPIVEE